MKFNSWKLDDLIEHLQLLRHSPDFDCRHVIRVSGEIQAVNGERKDGQSEEEIWG